MFGAEVRDFIVFGGSKPYKLLVRYFFGGDLNGDGGTNTFLCHGGSVSLAVVQVVGMERGGRCSTEGVGCGGVGEVWGEVWRGVRQALRKAWREEDVEAWGRCVEAPPPSSLIPLPSSSLTVSPCCACALSFSPSPSC